MKQKLAITFILGQMISLASVGVAMFWAAGRIDWWAAWAVIAVWVIWFATEDIILLRTNPGLMAERMNPPKDGKSWDRAILIILRLVQLARYILAGLDQRHGWTVGFPFGAQVAGLVVCILSTALFFWAVASNRYFSQVVRIQSDRGHVVATNGPYRYVRHPAYLASLLFDLALSTVLGSWWAILAGGLCAVLYIPRTALEDRTLTAELQGYAGYAKQVRFRLVPGLW